MLGVTLASVRGQTFTDWELCLVENGVGEPRLSETLDRAHDGDPRIRITRRETKCGIAEASNDALTMAEGEFVVLLDLGDELHPDALALTDQTLRAAPETDFAYSDEDRVDADGNHAEPFFKPGWSPERLRTQMYVGRVSVLRRSLVDGVGGFDPGLEGSHEWDLILKVTERARAVAHIPRILCHRRAPRVSTSLGERSSGCQSADAARRAVQAHCRRIGLPARVEIDAVHPDVYHLQPVLAHHPKVSIVIPTAGRIRKVWNKPVALATHCVRSIVSTSTYDAYEIVCVADASTDPAVLDELGDIGGDRLQVVGYDRPFNFAAKVNLGVRSCDGEHLLLLNDDMEVITPDWIERMVMYSGLPGIGAVGGRLLREDDRIQHAGVLFEGGLPGHVHRGAAKGFTGHANEVIVAQNFLAVTGACMMTPREVFDEAGGLTTALSVNYNDIDYCLKLISGGLRVVYDPDTVLYHFESSSRSSKVEGWEIDRFLSRWLPLTGTDPFRNPALRRRGQGLRGRAGKARRKLRRWLR